MYEVNFPNGRSIEVSSISDAIRIASENLVIKSVEVNEKEIYDPGLRELEKAIIGLSPGHEFDRKWAREVADTKSRSVGYFITKLINRGIVEGNNHIGRYRRTQLSVSKRSGDV